MTESPRRILWFRRDLRINDHPALLAAGENHDVVGLFVLDPTLLRDAGGPRTVFLLRCLAALDAAIGGKLLVITGDPVVVVPAVAAAVAADEVHISADYMPYGRKRDDRVRDALATSGVALVATGSPYAVAPGRVRKPDGSNYSVFTPYFGGWTEHGYRGPAGSGSGIVWADIDGVFDPAGFPDRVLPADLLEHQLSGVPNANLSTVAELPVAGEAAAAATWKEFLAGPITDYHDDRNRPDHEGTSRLSPYLKWGCIHPRTLLADVKGLPGTGPASYRREIAWREFFADLVFHKPESLKWSLNPIIDDLPWDTGTVADQHFEAWKQGRTGFPYIDAAMRQLLTQGWMHNRLRMSVGSFLVKDLHLRWQLGAAHFMDYLVDGDIASNNQGWLWVAGGGPQASPFFRIFHPITQGLKFDPDGDYVRKFVPELADIPGAMIHTPWDLPGGPPNGYPMPIIDHQAEREETLRRWAARPPKPLSSQQVQQAAKHAARLAAKEVAERATDHPS
ncbi:deoxyribodipyrimidine photo-lyase [Nakamurella antarctica]|uniref:Deoxyribodipyrimidine photo-lyase n=1 Tax=Nakamurella antarctica TaxID=1902245 RepID=A0A3G8ZJ80_9ACTN|nr:deoxyribodipyrimidine photo-lyase [Nakamurella antarctica]AZI57280.1 deoxyribodipyrimidine photo-lyase [Nakamurella antarctica]